jgi:hypothetical protein
MKETFFVTKWALTKGILQVQATRREGISYKKGYFIDTQSRKLSTNLFFNDDFHESLEAAQKHVEKIKERKLANLQKQIGKIQKQIIECVKIEI